MSRPGAVRLWLLLALLVSATLGLQQLSRQGMMGASLYSGQSLEAGIQVLHDPGGRMQVHDAQRAFAAGRFHAPDSEELSFRYSSDAIWLTTTAANAGNAPQQRYLEIGPPRLEDVRLYLPRPEGGMREIRNGLKVPVVAREIPSRQLVAALELPAQSEQRLFIRIKSRNSMLVEVRLWEPARFLVTARHMDLLNGLQFGALLLFALYAFTAAAAMRERAYLYFGITLLSYAAYDISILQYGHQYLWPEAPEWSLRSPGCMLSVSIFGLGMVVASLLETRTRFPRWDRALRALALCGLLLVLPLALGDYGAWVQRLNLVGLLQLLVTIGVTLQAVVVGTRGAALLLGAFLLLWFSSLLRVGQILGWLPQSILSEYSQGWAMVVAGLLMAMTQADRVRRLAAEREATRRELVQAQVRAREQAEREVAERTRELEQARDEAEASSRAKSAFLTQLSHELRTPLHSILGHGGLIAADAKDAATQRHVGAIQRSGRHLLALIDDLLEQARGEVGGRQPELQPLLLRHFLESVAEETRELARNHGARLETRLGADLPPAIRADSMRLRQVLINLIANACRHGGAGHITLEAESVAGASGGRRLRIRVRDDGKGIAPGDRERIFEPFEQADRQGVRPGLGLGLAISRQLVTMMGGTLTLEAGEGGACFLIELTPDEVDPPARRPSLPAASRRYAGPVRRLLVVDDIADNRELLGAMLVAMGFETVGVADATAALTALAEGGFDAVLTDQIMPGMDGWALLAEARRRGCGLPFLLLSAALPDTPAGGGATPGFAAMLLKPVDPGPLADALGRCLGLAWRHEAGAPATVAATLVAPSAAAIARLLAAAGDGLVSDIEDWVEQVLVEEPAAREFALAVREAVRRVDFEAISRLCGVDPHAVHAR